MKIEVKRIEDEGVDELYQACVVGAPSFKNTAYRERDPGRTVTGLLATLSVSFPNWPSKPWAKNIEIEMIDENTN